MKKLMLKAHEMTRETIRHCPENVLYNPLRFIKTDYRATFAEALRIAWRERGNAGNALTEWQNMTDDEKILAVTKMAYRCNRTDKRECNSKGKERPNYFSWIKTADDLQTVVNQAFVELPHQFDLAEAAEERTGEEKPLACILANAVREAARKIALAELKHARASKTDKNGNDYIIMNAAPLAERIAPNPEEAYIIRESIREACETVEDYRIIMLVAQGVPYESIAKAIGRNAMYVCRRVKKIRERHAAQA